MTGQNTCRRARNVVAEFVRIRAAILQIRNPKHEIRNKFECAKPKGSKRFRSTLLPGFGQVRRVAHRLEHFDLAPSVIASDFVLRISDFPRARPRRIRRSAAILVAALVCLVVVAVIGASLMQTVLLQHRQLLHDQDQLQVFWLAESAVQRAAMRLTAAPAYRGETWQVEGRSARGPWTGVAIIRVEIVPDDIARRQVVVEAHCGDEPSRRVAQRRQVVVLLPVQGVSS
jgi:hypothetical protein